MAQPKAGGGGAAVVPCPVLTVASWPAYRFLKRQVWWSVIPISFRIFHSLLWSTQSKALANKPLNISKKRSVQYYLKYQSWLFGWLFIFDNEYQALWKFSTCQKCIGIEFQEGRLLKKFWKWRNFILLSEVKGTLAKKKSTGMKCIFDHCYVGL